MGKREGLVNVLNIDVTIMDFDKKLLYIALQHLGTPARQYWSMP